MGPVYICLSLSLILRYIYCLVFLGAHPEQKSIIADGNNFCVFFMSVTLFIHIGFDGFMVLMALFTDNHVILPPCFATASLRS